MKLSKIVLRVTLIFALLALPIVWLITTNSGLKVIIGVGKVFSPIKFNYSSVQGKLIGAPITLRNLTLEYDKKNLQISTVSLDWQLNYVVAENVQGLAKFLPRSDLLVDQDLALTTVTATLDSYQDLTNLRVKLIGKSANAALQAYAKIIYQDEVWGLNQARIEIGKNFATIKQQTNHNYAYDINIANPEVIFTRSNGALNATGILNLKKNTADIKINSKFFNVQNYQVKNLHSSIHISDDLDAPLTLNIIADHIIIEQQPIHKVNIQANGSLKEHTLIGNAIYENKPITLQAVGKFEDSTWISNMLSLKYDRDKIIGKGNYNFKKQNGILNMHGKVYNLPLQMVINVKNHNKFNIDLTIHQDPENYLNATVAVDRTKLTGFVNVKVEDLAFLMERIPYLTRLKGNLAANAKISGTLSEPIITSETHITNINTTIPAMGIKISPMELHLIGDKNGRFTLTGKGQMRRGPGEFAIRGFIEQFKENVPNSINITGSQVEFVNNQIAHLIASHNLDLHYDLNTQRLDVDGEITIHEGIITLADQSSQTVKSKDVIFINEVTPPKSAFNLNPNINLRIEEGVHFSGFDLDADITGKLAINNRHGAMYGDGRITVKEGAFKLPGKKLAIQRGRLLFPPGTLLVNPVLDIKMHDKNERDLEIIVQGTAQKPVITEQGLSNNQDRAISQAILTGSSMLAGNLLQDKLKISEIGIRSQEDQHIEFFDDPKDKNNLKNKDLVLGRPLGKRLYLQYLHNMGDDNKRVRLKYSLNPVWAIGLESGNQGGGADLSFAIERD